MTTPKHSDAAATTLPVSDLDVERLALGELDPATAADVRARLDAAEEGGAAARLAAIDASNAAILAAHPPARAAAVIERRLADAAASRRSAWWMAAPMIAAAAVVLLVVRGQGVDPELDPDALGERVAAATTTGASAGAQDSAANDGIRLKGAESRLVLHRKAADTGDGAERLAEGQEVDEGDVLQVSYIAAGATHGVIVSIDGRGVVTQHFPSPGSPPAAAHLEQGGAIPLSSAYELDDAPDFERFFLVTAAAELDVDAIVRAAEQLGRTPARARGASLDLPPTLDQRAFLLRKAPAPGSAPTPGPGGHR
ncbi:MAG: hypothetical protein R3A79_12550 [Nannocystaceae bacterium]